MACQCGRPAEARVFEHEGFACPAGDWCDDCWAGLADRAEELIGMTNALVASGVPGPDAVAAVEKLINEEEPS